MKIVRIGLLVLALPLLLAAQKPSGKPPVKAAAHTVKTAAKAKPKVPAEKSTPQPATANGGPKLYPPQTIAFAGGVTMTQMVYRTLPGFRPLSLDLYQTTAKGNPRPVLVFVHDGDWKSGDTRHNGTFGDFPSVLASLAARGYVVASVEYRLSGEARFPAALQDVKSAVRWLRGHAGEYNLDSTRVAIWGASAGGQLAALTGVSCGVTALEPPADFQSTSKETQPSDCVQAVIDWYGYVDFENLASDLGQSAPDTSIAGDYLGCEPALCTVGVARNASPLTYVEAMSPPFLIQQGADDAVVSPKQSQALYDALRAKNVPAELVMYPGVLHNFASGNGPPGTPDPATNQQALAKLESFLAATFPPKPANSPVKPAKKQALPY